MKIALITDTHFGARADSAAFQAHFRKFYDTVFFPALKKHKVEHVIHLGDVFDKRTSVNFQTLQGCVEYFFDKLKATGLEMDIILGNHDVYYKNTNTVNSPNLLLGKYDNVTVYDSPDNPVENILYVPWINAENSDSVARRITKSKETICLGHLEIAGFVMHKGMTNETGLDASIFDKFRLTCSGHFHHRQRDGKIVYLGSPYEITWADYDDTRGFHILDTEKLTLTFVPNPHRMFHKIYWDDRTETELPVPQTLTGMCVRIIVINKENYARFDAYLDSLSKNGVEDVKIVENFSDFEADGIDDENIAIEDTITMLRGYVDSIDTTVDKRRIKNELEKLYVEAQHLE